MSSNIHTRQPVMRVKNLTMSFGETLVQEKLTFDIKRRSIFIIMGPSGCGKSTLMKHMIGLVEPAAGKVEFLGEDFWGGTEEHREELLRRAGILFQNGALWSSMTVAENVALPLQLHSLLRDDQIRDMVALKLALVGLADAGDKYPADISGGMRKRAGLARALALDPEILFLDEPSAGLDPLSARRLDDLILQLRDTLGITMIVVTHELDSMMAIGDDSIFLDNEQRTMIDRGSPQELRKHSRSARVRAFLNRSDEDSKSFTSSRTASEKTPHE